MNSDSKSVVVDGVEYESPRELAEDTLQTLILFTGKLADLCLTSADEIESTKSEHSFQKLLDGITTMHETANTVKSLLQISVNDPTSLAEADLISILKDILEAHERGDQAHRVQLLREVLPRNLEQWGSDAIPAMIRSRDS